MPVSPVRRPLAVAFDVVETLMSLQPMGARLREVGLPAAAVPEWLARTLLHGIGTSVTGDYLPFPVAADQALRAVAGHRLDDDQVARVLAGLGDLPAHPDAAPAIRLLREGGVRVACLTNGAAAGTQAFLDRSGLAGQVERVVATAEVRDWKPSARVYRYAAEVLGLDPARLALVAAHAWDCHGAARAGLVTGWTSRLEGGYGARFAPADVAGADLVEVARGLLALPADPADPG